MVSEKRRALYHIKNLGTTKSSRLPEMCLRECYSRLATASLGAVPMLADRSNGPSQFCTRSCRVQSLGPATKAEVSPRAPKKKITRRFRRWDPTHGAILGHRHFSRGSKSAMTPSVALSYLVPFFFPAPQRCLSPWCAATTAWQVSTRKA